MLALGYELECQRNGGDWRLRRVVGQKWVNVNPPKRVEVDHQEEDFPSEDGKNNIENLEETTKRREASNLNDAELSTLYLRLCT